MTGAEGRYFPDEFIVPVVGLHSDDAPGQFLGTGSFVTDRPVLLTCNHVLDNWGEQYGICLREDSRPIRARVLAREPKLDLALLEVPYAPPHVLPIANDEDIKLNEIVSCFEYGTTVSAGGRTDFSPATRLGNVTRLRNLTDRFGEAGESMLELSFPALKGASGAPVTTLTRPFTLWGVVKANVSYELIPAQIETVVDAAGRAEEQTRFYLPQAIAIHAHHIRRLISRL